MDYRNHEGVDKSFQLKYHNKVLKVEEKLSSVNYRLVGDDGKTFVAHFNQLKKVFARPEEDPADPEPLRRSNRERRAPARLQDYDLTANERSLV